MTERSWRGVRADLNLDFTAWVVIWTVSGFTRSGLLGDRVRRSDGSRPVLRDFRHRLHELLDQIVRPLP